LKIVIVNSFFPPWRGGAETYVYNLARNLVRRGHNVVVYCGAEPIKPGTEVVDGIRIERLRILCKLYGTPVMPTLSARLMRESADVLHANFPSPLGALLTGVVSKWKSIPSVLTWHNDLPAVTRTAGAFVAIHNEIVLPVYMRYFDRVIATSKTYANTSPILQRFADRVALIPNGVDTARFNPRVSGEEIRKKLGLTGHNLLLFVGALTEWHRYKGLDVLLSAMQLLKNTNENVRLLVVGDGSLAPEYRHLADSLSVSDDVIFAGNVPEDDLPKCYACSDMLIQPSKDRSEGFGLTILEANATGKPVIGSDVGGIPSVIDQGKNGFLVPPNDPVALSEEIRSVLHSESVLSRMGRNGRVIAEKHDWSIIAERTEQLYEGLI